MTLHGGGGPSRPTRWLRDLVRAGRWHRRLLASGLLAGAMALGLQSLEPPPPPSSPIVTAARDVAAGTRLESRDVTIIQIAPDNVPDGAATSLGDVMSRTLVSAVRRGEPLTDVRLVGASAPGGDDESLVTAPVRIADAEAVALLRPGDVVDVLGAGPPSEGSGSTSARLLASAVRVVTVPGTAGDQGLGDIGGDGALLLVTTTSATAARLAGAAVTDRLSVVLRGR